jgi:hypothetical protein
MTLPGFKHSSRTPQIPASTRSLSSYLVGGLEGHLYPNLYSPDCINIRQRSTRPRPISTSSAGIKGHAEIGGFARWGIKVLQMSAEIGRKTDLPLYVHFGQLWGLPKERSQLARTPTRSRSASSRSCGRATSWRIRSRAIPAASSTARARCTR